MRAPWKLAAPLAFLALGATGCDGILGITVLDAGAEGDASSDAPSGADAGVSTAMFGLHGPANKVDLLFMVDNSPSMGDKQTLLALAVPTLVGRLVDPECLDTTSGQPTGVTAANGTCPVGSKPEFAPVHDLHIGIVTSSLGGRGGDQCPDDAMNPAFPNLSAHTNDKGELINRGGDPADAGVEVPVTDATSPDNFLSYFPAGGPNSGMPTPPTTPIMDANQLIGDFEQLVEGVHEHGCGFEAQNEAWYRFLVQPDPFLSIDLGPNETRTLSGIDQTILKQRADFLRPDSMLAVIVVTDENEEAADPLAIGGQGWAFDNTAFPGSPSMAAPEGTYQCNLLDPTNPTKTGPNDPNCTSCVFIRGASNFATECPNDPPGGTGGFLDPSDDALNVRFFHQKQRFGLFAGYPTSRYVMGLQKPAVPSVGLAFPGDKDHEHDSMGNYVGDQPGQQNCVNPIYAQDLPTSVSQDLCHLRAGPRTPDLVYYAAIAGVPHQLLQQDPTNAMSPQKDVLSDADWKLIMGNDPEHYDFSGADFHMIESIQERTSSTTDPSLSVWANRSICPDTDVDNCDPINGREFATNKSDLQFSCIFPLITVNDGSIVAFQKDCTSPGAGDPYKGACDCAVGSLDGNSPLCLKSGSSYTQVQINGKAYPPVREMIIAKAMSQSTAGNQGVVSSICPITADIGETLDQATQDPLFGFNPGMNAIADRFRASLAPSGCLPRPLPTAASGAVSCTMIVSLPAKAGATCKNPGSVCDVSGLAGPGTATLSQQVLNEFCDAQEQAFVATGGKPGSSGDPAQYPACGVNQVTGFDSGSCATSSTDAGWCYLTGSAAGSCQQTLAFTFALPPAGSTSTLVCPSFSADGGI